MYEVHVISHPKWDEANKLIFSVKMFRMVTHLGLDECKTIVENMMGKKWDTSLPIERRVIRFQRQPYIMKADTLVQAEQFRLEFKHGGFTVEVKKDNGQG